MHRQRLGVSYQFHAHLAVQRIMSLFVGVQRRFVFERLVTFVALETMLYVLRLLRIHLLLVVANISQVEPERLFALELHTAVRTVERTF